MMDLPKKKRTGARRVLKQALHLLRKRVVKVGPVWATLWVTATAEVMAVALGWLLIQIRSYSQEAGRAVYLATLTIPLIVAPIVGGTIVLLLEDLEEARVALHEMATRDGLTRLFNRTYFMERLRQEMSYAHRHEVALSLMVFDADDFKHINDRYGHSEGDRVLESIAKTCTLLLRESDVLARYGGEEFVLLLPSTSGEGACLVAEKLRVAVEDMVMPAGEPEDRIAVTVSIGISTRSGLDDTADGLFSRADKALYKAKKSGKNRWTISWEISKAAAQHHLSTL